MNEAFSIKANWILKQENVNYEDASAEIVIELLGKKLTENYDTCDGQKRSSVVLAPYPMALWFVSNWWRLRWEPTPWEPSCDWRMSHMLSAAGYGYSWPTLGFQTDGETVRITSLPTTGTDGASVIYSTLFSALISANKFEEEIESFVANCNTKFGNTDVRLLWDTIQEEKNDKDLAMFRQIEARLGFDAGEGPEEAIIGIMKKSKEFGYKSTQELSTLLHGNSKISEEIQCLDERKAGTIITIEDISELRELSIQRHDQFLPWDLGYYLAKEARHIWGINNIFSAKKLCEIIGTSPNKLYFSSGKGENFGLGVKHSENRFSVALNKKHHTSMRFMAARIICDAIIASEDDRVLPATANKTARQKTQRAFAAELLCPINLIKERIGNDYSNEDTWVEIAEDFDVNPLVIKSQLANNNLIPQFENTNLWFDFLQVATPTYAIQEFV